MLIQPSNCCEPAISHDYSPLIGNAILPLPLTCIFLALRHPTTRCSLLPHNATLFATGERPNTPSNRRTASQTSAPHPWWLCFCSLTTPQIPSPTSSVRYWGPSRVCHAVYKSRYDTFGSGYPNGCSGGAWVAARGCQGWCSYLSWWMGQNFEELHVDARMGH